ncbi:MAG TPA: glycosyltransferase family 2 protein [Vicinamibacteria bacterium]|nr:glycosyltransferase family 2 protein [Vicinamibacteria bacterium]
MSTPASGGAAFPRVSAIVVSYNTRDDLRRSLEALRAHAGVPLETIVVDNASTDGTAEAVRARFPEVHLIANPANLGFSRANNLGLRVARGEFVLVLNSDCEVRPGAVAGLAAILEARPDVAIVGPRTLGTDGAPQVSFGPSLTPLAEWRQGRLVRGVKAGHADARRRAAALAAQEQEPDWVSASCFLARKSALDAVGGFDEAFFLYEEDVDLCLRVRQAGGRILYTPRAEVVHHLGRSMERAPERARLEYHRSHLRFYAKHNSAAQRVALRAWMAGRAAWGWLRAAPGTPGRQRRAEERAILRLALFG